jgi:hypothetical protein
MEIERKGPRGKIEFTEELVSRIADLAVKDNSAVDISKETKLSYPIVRKIMRSPEFQEACRGIALQNFSMRLGKAMAVVDRQLAEGNLDAAKLVFKAAGVAELEKQEKVKTEQQLVVVLPGASQPKEITSEVINDEGITDLVE